MRRIDNETREVIAKVAREIEDEGYEMNRRSVAREFGVSPQTGARILDGADARRGAIAFSGQQVTGRSGKRAAIVVGALAALALIVAGMRGEGGVRQERN